MVAADPSHGPPQKQTTGKWSFLSNHALVMVYVVLHPGSTVRDIAADVGITERATLAIIRDLDQEQIVERTRDGRRNTYAVDFAHLSRVRRGDVPAPLTPRSFVEVVVRTLYDLARRYGTLPPGTTEPEQVKAEELQPRMGSWVFFTNHMLVVLALAGNHMLTVRELANTVNITERAVVGIVNQLETEGVIARTRDGRRNIYSIDFEAFRNFRGWKTERWALPAELVDIATGSIQALARQ